MKTIVSRWGNGLGVRIPKKLAANARLTAGTRVVVLAKGERIIITRAEHQYRLTDLLKGMTPERMHEAFDCDSGNESGS